MLTAKKGAPKGNKNATKDAKYIRKNRSFKASDQEYAIIEEKARQAGVTIGAYIREKALSD